MPRSRNSSLTRGLLDDEVVTSALQSREALDPLFDPPENDDSEASLFAETTFLNNNLEISAPNSIRDESPNYQQQLHKTKKYRRRILALIAFLVTLSTVLILAGIFEGKKTHITETEAYDFMVQSVCEDGDGVDPYNCSGTMRNIEIGESLPYVKHDFDPRTGLLYQMSNSIPLRDSSTPSKIRVLQTLDFANSDGSPLHPKNITFIQFDEDYDGYNANNVLGDRDNNAYVSIVGTADPSGDVQLFVTEDTSSSSSPCKLTNSWGLFSNTESSGEHLFKLNIVRAPLYSDEATFSCPSSYNNAYTTWSRKSNFTFGSVQSKPKFMETIVAKHFAGDSFATSSSAEFEFFTREYGMTRWEAWVKKTELPSVTPSDGILCGGPKTSLDGDKEWVMVDCRDWSQVRKMNFGLELNGLRTPTMRWLIDGGNMLVNGDGGGKDLTKWRGDEKVEVEYVNDVVTPNHIYANINNKLIQIRSSSSDLDVFGGIHQVFGLNRNIKDLSKKGFRFGGTVKYTDLEYNNVRIIVRQLNEEGLEIPGAFEFERRIVDDDDDNDDWWVPSEDDDDDDDDDDIFRRMLRHNYKINESTFQYHLEDSNVHSQTAQFEMSIEILGPKLFYLDDLFFGAL